MKSSMETCLVMIVSRCPVGLLPSDMDIEGGESCGLTGIGCKLRFSFACAA